MDTREIKAIIEALLFTWGDPLAIDDISEILEFNKLDIEIIEKGMVDDFIIIEED